MQKTDKALSPILDYLFEKRGFDFSGYHKDMLERRIGKRLAATACKDFSAYLVCLPRDPDELDYLIDVITINVSRFFRDTLIFELMADRILPDIVRKKAQTPDRSLRVWSAGCARGEEPYSVAILLQELLAKEEVALTRHLSASFLDNGSKVQGLNSRADGYLTQPAEPSVLLATINALLRMKRAEEKMAEQLRELQRRHATMLDRESRVIELKREVNELLAQAGQPPRYPSAVEKDER